MTKYQYQELSSNICDGFDGNHAEIIKYALRRVGDTAAAVDAGERDYTLRDMCFSYLNDMNFSIWMIFDVYYFETDSTIRIKYTFQAVNDEFIKDEGVRI